MRIEYDCTLDELADTYLRTTARSKLARRARWWSAFLVMVVTGGGLFLVLSLEGATLTERLVFAVPCGAIAAGWSFFYHRRGMKRRLLKHLREKLESHGPLHFAVELRGDCVWTKQGGTQTSFDWANVRDVLDSADGIELPMRDGGFVFVRSRGFPSREARERFKEIASERMGRASAGAAAGGGPSGEDSLPRGGGPS